MEPYACTREDCRYTMRGGLHLPFGFTPGCTSGFSVVGNSGNRFVLSAGHCNGFDPGSVRHNGGVLYGTVNGDAVRNNVDAERIVRSNVSWTNSSDIWLADGLYEPIVTYLPYLMMVPGLTIQASVRSGGQPMSAIATANYSPSWVPNGHQFLTTVTPFGLPGDSGSPIYLGSVGLGLLSGGTGAGLPCLQGCVVFSALEFALSELNVSLGA